MGNLEGKKEAASTGPRHRGEKPRARAAPLTTRELREGAAGVRDRAEAAMAEMEYEMKVLTGAASQEAMKAHLDARLEARRKPKRGFFIDRPFVTRVHERMRACRKKRSELVRARDESKRELQRQFRVRQFEALYVITHTSVPAGDTEQLNEAYEKFDAAFPENLELHGGEEQLRITRNALSQLGVLDVDPAYARAIMLDLEKQKSDVALMTQALDEDRVAVALLEQSATTDDPEKAIAEAFKQGSPELQQAYQDYLEVWRSENVIDVFAPPMPDISGIELESVSEVQVRAALSVIQESGVIIHMGSQNFGEVHFGTLARQCALYEINGEPKLFIYDQNADRGVRGPIDPTEVRGELAHALIDDYFSEQFRKFSSAGSEADPQKIVDSKLFKIVHAFLPPGSDQHVDRLDATQRRIIINAAVLLAEPDKRYVSLKDKTRFLDERIISQPDRLALAKRILMERDLSKEPQSLSEFASRIEQG